MSAQYTDDYSRLQVEGFDENLIKGVATGFLSLFGLPGSRTVYEEDAATVEINIKRANGNRLAALVRRGTVSTPSDVGVQTGEKFTNLVREFPLIETISSIESTQLLKLMMNENPFGGGSRFKRLQQRVFDLNMESTQKAINMFEYLASQSILEGSHPAIFGTTNSDLIYDFLRLASHTVTVGTAWNGVTPPIMGDIDGACALVEVDSYMTPSFLGLGEDAMSDFIKDPTVQALADNRRIELIQISSNFPVPPEYEIFARNGWNCRGRLRTLGGRTLWMFGYNAEYKHPDTGTQTRYLPKDQGFILDINARNDRWFGPPDRMPVTSAERMWYQETLGFSMERPIPISEIKGVNAGVVDSRMFSYYAEQKDKKTIQLITQSAPIFPTIHTDAIVTLKGLHT